MATDDYEDWRTITPSQRLTQAIWLSIAVVYAVGLGAIAFDIAGTWVALATVAAVLLAAAGLWGWTA